MAAFNSEAAVALQILRAPGVLLCAPPFAETNAMRPDADRSQFKNFVNDVIDPGELEPAPPAAVRAACRTSTRRWVDTGAGFSPCALA